MSSLNHKEVFQLAQKKGWELQFVKTVESVIPEEWELFRVKEYCKGRLDVKVRRLYPDGELKLNEDGYEYNSIFIDKEPSTQIAFIELTLIQKWLREKQGVFVEIHHLIPTSYIFYFRPCLEKGVRIKNARIEGRIVYETYENALLNGIHEALKLI